jgi:hypothetical protein
MWNGNHEIMQPCNHAPTYPRTTSRRFVNLRIYVTVGPRTHTSTYLRTIYPLGTLERQP